MAAPYRFFPPSSKKNTKNIPLRPLVVKHSLHIAITIDSNSTRVSLAPFPPPTMLTTISCYSPVRAINSSVIV